MAAEAVVVACGMVRVTVTTVSAQAVQAVTVVVKPRGQPFGPMGQTKGVGVAEAGATGTLVVRVYGMVVNPVGQIST
jgi:hypothetical protein